jgi:general secretion pathway protein I
MHPDPASRDSGFTLLEVMAAFVIAALACIMLYQAGFNGAAETATAARYQEAVVRAQSRLASIGVLTPLQTEQLSGDDGSFYHWQLRIAQLQSSGSLSLYAVQVTEQFGTRQVVLNTERLASGQ